MSSQIASLFVMACTVNKCPLFRMLSSGRQVLPQSAVKRSCIYMRNGLAQWTGSEVRIRLTRRQGDILDLAAQGLTDKEVAVRLSLSVSTVRSHLERFYRANGVRNKAQAIAVWATRKDSMPRS